MVSEFGSVGKCSSSMYRTPYAAQDGVENHTIRVPFVRTADNLADLFTKAFLEGHQWDEAVAKIGVGPKDGPVRPPPAVGRRPEKPWGKAKPKKKAKAKAKAQTVLKAKVEDLESEGATSAPGA